MGSKIKVLSKTTTTFTRGRVSIDLNLRLKCNLYREWHRFFFTKTTSFLTESCVRIFLFPPWRFSTHINLNYLGAVFFVGIQDPIRRESGFSHLFCRNIGYVGGFSHLFCRNIGYVGISRCSCILGCTYMRYLTSFWWCVFEKRVTKIPMSMASSLYIVALRVILILWSNKIINNIYYHKHIILY